MEIFLRFHGLHCFGSSLSKKQQILKKFCSTSRIYYRPIARRLSTRDSTTQNNKCRLYNDTPSGIRTPVEDRLRLKTRSHESATKYYQRQSGRRYKEILGKPRESRL
jgi:hypothetical protein